MQIDPKLGKSPKFIFESPDNNSLAVDSNLSHEDLKKVLEMSILAHFELYKEHKKIKMIRDIIDVVLFTIIVNLLIILLCK